MAKSIKAVLPKKKLGRPSTGRDPVMALRLPKALAAAADKWAAERGLTRSAAIRQWIEYGLAERWRAPKAARANIAESSKMAGRTIDKIGDPAASSGERAKRKRRLLKGPTEFREMRDNQGKAKP